MSLAVLGLNHKTASITLRNKVAFALEELVPYLRELIALPWLEEVVVLSTCNRTEWIVYLPDQHFSVFIQWLQQDRKLLPTEWQESFYCYRQKQALIHLIKVASGLDSMILGEPQILGQVKAAYQLAKEFGAVDQELHAIFQQIFGVAKRVRTQTSIGKSSLSVAYTAVQLIRQFFAHIEETKVLLIGAGDTIEKIAAHLKKQGVTNLIIANRTLDNAHNIAETVGGQAVHLTEVPALLRSVDIVFSSTGSPLPILGKGTVQSALKAGKRHPLIMVDLAVPRDIEPEVAELEDVYLYTVDDLQQVVQDNAEKRQEAAASAELVIQQAVENFWLQQSNQAEVSQLIRYYRTRAEAVRDLEVERALIKLAQGQSSEQALQELATRLTNKLLHPICAELKRAQAAGCTDALEYAKKLLAIEQSNESIPS